MLFITAKSLLYLWDAVARALLLGNMCKMCVSNVSSRTVLDECTEPVLVGMGGLRGV